ncbi:MAG: hypothetical protein KC431_05535, partial [Myxococcales bacterium]|nr:hypothetical protein [Myxococcales bacterium]
MSADSGHPGTSPVPATDVQEAERSPWGLAGVALIAGLLQVVASIVLGMARADRFATAASESPGIYLLLAALLSAAAFSVWMMRERPLIAMALTVLWPVGLWLGLR